MTHLRDHIDPPDRAPSHPFSHDDLITCGSPRDAASRSGGEP